MDADKAQIADVLIRYATGIDFKDWALLRTCWTEDVDCDYGEVGRYSGVDAISGLMEQLHSSMGPTYHRLSNFTITVDGDRATARSYVFAHLQAVPDDPATWLRPLVITTTNSPVLPTDGASPAAPRRSRGCSPVSR